MFQTSTRTSETPNEGVFVNGLFIEGARWNVRDSALEEQFSKVLVSTMPIIHMSVSKPANSWGAVFNVTCV